VDRAVKNVQGITILGSTGSIGVSTLNVVERHADRYHIVALTAHRDVEGLFQQCLRHRPDYAVMADTDAAEQLRQRLQVSLPDVRVLGGAQALEEVAALETVDIVMAAIVGAAGLLPALRAAQSGKRILLANKEALVMSGALFMQAVEQGHATLLPVDSEHNALFQSMPAGYRPGAGSPAGVTRIMLTASGGPFRTTPVEQLSQITPDQACAHELGDGAQDTCGFGNHDEQGTGGYRGLLALRDARERRTGRDSPAECGALDGAVLRRFGAGSTGQSRHAHTDCTLPVMARSH